MRCALVLVCLLAPVAASANPFRVEGQAPPGPPRNYGNLRAGTSTGNQNGRAELCLELAPLDFLSVEGCGTGSGFLHRDPDPEVAHFRLKLRLASFPTSWGWLQLHAAGGFAELQIDEDEAGFDFGGTGARGVETAGPEAGASIRALVPAGRFELILELTASAAWLVHAPELVRPERAFQPSVGFSVGAGF